MLFLSILLFSVLNVVADNYNNFALWDFAENKEYKITAADKGYYISYAGAALEFINAENCVSVQACAGIITFFSVRVHSIDKSVITVISYNTKNKSTTQKYINAFAKESENLFCTDRFGGTYFVSLTDACVVCREADNTVEKYRVNAPVKQLLCLDFEKVLALTAQGVYLLQGGKVYSAGGDTPSAPVRCIGDRKVSDSKGEIFVFDNGMFLKFEETPALSEAETDEALQKESQSAEANQNKTGYKSVEAGTTLAQIKKAYKNSKVTKAVKYNGKTFSSGAVGTGTKVYFSDGDVLTIIVKGDLTGEGNVNSRDIKAALDSISKKKVLSGDFAKGADLDNDGKITSKDVVLISKIKSQ